MGFRSRFNHGSPPYLYPFVSLAVFLSLTAVFFLKVSDFAYQTKTVAGHNLKPTPWHWFYPKIIDEGTSYSRATKILQCQYFQCRSNPYPIPPQLDPSKLSSCPQVFRWIYHDLEPWSQSRISFNHLMEAKDYAAFRVVIVGGRLFVHPYYACVQSRMIINDKPTLNKTEHSSRPLPLFRYCTTAQHFDIPFPDWSFWGWLRLWGKQVRISWIP